MRPLGLPFLVLCLCVLAGGALLSHAQGHAPVMIVTVGRGPEAIAVDGPAHRAFVVDHDDKSLDVVDTETGAIVRTVALPVDVATVAVDTRRARVFVASTASDAGGVVRAGHGVMVLDARDGRLVRTVSIGAAPDAIAVDESLGLVFVGVAARGGEVVKVLDASSGVVLRTVRLGHAHGLISPSAPPSPCAMGVDERRGRVIAAGEMPSAFHVLDARSGHLVLSTFVPLRLCPQVAATLAIDEGTGHTFVGVAFPTNRVLMFDTKTGKLLHTTTYPLRTDQPRVIADDEGTAHLFALIGAFGGRRIHVLDARSGVDLRTIATSRQYDTVAVDARRHRAFLSGADATRQVTPDHWSWIPGGIRRLIPFLPPPPSARRYAGRIDVIDTRTGRLMRTLPLPAAPALLVADDYTGHAFALSFGSMNGGGQMPGRGTMAIITVP